MGFEFDVGDVTVLSQGQRIGEIFVGFVGVLERVTWTPSGFSFMAAEFVDLDAKALAGFYAALVELLGKSSSVVLDEQVRPVLAIVTTLLRRSGSPPSSDPAEVGDGFAEYVTQIDATIGTL